MPKLQSRDPYTLTLEDIEVLRQDVERYLQSGGLTARDKDDIRVGFRGVEASVGRLATRLRSADRPPEEIELDLWDLWGLLDAGHRFFPNIYTGPSLHKRMRRGRTWKARGAATKGKTEKTRAREDTVREVAAKKGVLLKRGDKYLDTLLLSEVNKQFVEKGLAGKRPLSPRAFRRLVTNMMESAETSPPK